MQVALWLCRVSGDRRALGAAAEGECSRQGIVVAAFSQALGFNAVTAASSRGEYLHQGVVPLHFHASAYCTVCDCIGYEPYSVVSQQHTKAVRCCKHAFRVTMHTASNWRRFHSRILAVPVAPRKGPRSSFAGYLLGSSLITRPWRPSRGAVSSFWKPR